MEPVKGIDISTHNGDVDIAGMKNKINFVIIRCGYGNDITSQDDAQYRNNVRKCEAAGMPYGVYLYSYATNADMAKSEAEHTIRLLKGTNPLYGVWYDVEDSTLPGGETLVNNCVTYCEAIKAAGYYCGIYASLSFLNNQLNSSKLDGYDKWVAQWAANITYQKPYGIWQYTDSGVINGKTFDMNLAYKDYPRITQQGSDEVDMTKEEVTALIQSEAQKVYDANEQKYKTISSVPGWVKTDMQRVYSELQLLGTSKTAGDDIQVDASNTYLRLMVILARMLDKIDALENTGK